MKIILNSMGIFIRKRHLIPKNKYFFEENVKKFGLSIQIDLSFSQFIEKKSHFVLFISGLFDTLRVENLEHTISLILPKLEICSYLTLTQT